MNYPGYPDRPIDMIRAGEYPYRHPQDVMREAAGERIAGGNEQWYAEQHHATFKQSLPRDRLLWAGIDLDGCIAKQIWTPDNPTSDVGPPIYRNVQKLRYLHRLGYKPVIHTSRAWTDYERIEAWLRHHEIPFREIQCGKPLYAVYVDDRARHSEDEDWRPHSS